MPVVAAKHMCCPGRDSAHGLFLRRGGPTAYKFFRSTAMTHAILPGFMAIMFAIQDIAVGSYPTSQRLIFAGVVCMSLAAGLFFSRKEK